MKRWKNNFATRRRWTYKHCSFNILVISHIQNVCIVSALICFCKIKYTFNNRITRCQQTQNMSSVSIALAFNSSHRTNIWVVFSRNKLYYCWKLSNTTMLIFIIGCKIFAALCLTKHNPWSVVTNLGIRLATYRPMNKLQVMP